jgi:hypothetical protein
MALSEKAKPFTTEDTKEHGGKSKRIDGCCGLDRKGIHRKAHHRGLLLGPNPPLQVVENHHFILSHNCGSAKLRKIIQLEIPKIGMLLALHMATVEVSFTREDE